MERLQRVVEAASFTTEPHSKGLIVVAHDRNGAITANLRLVDPDAVQRLVHLLPQALAEQQRVDESVTE